MYIFTHNIIPNIYLCLHVNETHAGVLSDNVGEHKALYEFVEKGDWKGARSYLRDRPDSIFWAPASGRTVLHVATMEGHFKIVEGLVKLGKKQLVEMQDQDGFTALALAACYSEDMDIAKCIVNGEGGVGVLALANKKGEIPLLLAADSGRKRMTRFLFFRTPSDVLDQQSSRNRVLLLERCIQAHIFGKQMKRTSIYAASLHLFSIPSIFLLPHLNAPKPFFFSLTSLIYVTYILECFGRLLGCLREEKLNVKWFELADVALKMLKSDPQLPIQSLPYGFGGLHELARMPSAFLNGSGSEDLQTQVYNITDGKISFF